ncbi:hypothetical protein [Gymnodinialimonas hymeniacidonis]|uniref:hypothetical protein n=1 Tax=Gymnodinialimonas hymeniacidonis TaxID=3126508 RepID=UPI0034C6BC4A
MPQKLFAILLGLAALLAAPLSALTVAELTAIHETRNEPYELNSIVMDDEWRRAVAADLRFIDPSVAQEVLAAAASRFDAANIHIYQQADTSLVSHIVALEVEGEIVLLSWHSTAFFEIPELVERRIDLLDDVLQAFAPQRFQDGWAGQTFAATIENVHAWADGARDGPYPGWTYEDQAGVQSLGSSVIPDWVEITVTSLSCEPRYPSQGWAVQFFCVD